MALGTIRTGLSTKHGVSAWFLRVKSQFIPNVPPLHPAEDRLWPRTSLHSGKMEVSVQQKPRVGFSTLLVSDTVRENVPFQLLKYAVALILT